MYYAIGVSAVPSLHRESTDSLILGKTKNASLWPADYLNSSCAMFIRRRGTLYAWVWNAEFNKISAHNPYCTTTSYIDEPNRT